MISAEAARVGEELRASRLALGVSVEEMADHLRINRRYLSAIEEGRSENLPAQAYALGFVRSYAQALGLDAAELTRRFRDGVPAGVAGRTDLVFPEPVPKRGVPAGAVILVGAVILIGSYVAWWEWSGSAPRTVDAVPEPPARVDTAGRDTAPVIPPNLGQATPAGTAPPAASGTAAGQAQPTPGGTAPATQSTAAAGPSGAGPARPGVPASGQNTPAQTANSTSGRPGSAAPGAAPVPGAQGQMPTGLVPIPPQVAQNQPGPAPAGQAMPPAGASASLAPAQPAPPTTPAAPVQVEGQGRIVLRAAQVQGSDEGSWVQVRAKGSNRPLFSRVLRPGESYSVPVGDGMTLTTGKAEALEITVDGQASSALTGRTGVVRDLSLDPERLRVTTPG